jgi:hypothetical protein
MKILFISLLIFSTFANAENQIAVTTDNGQNRPLGSGYNSFTQTLKENCVQGYDSFNESEENRTVQALKTSSSFSEKDVMNRL